LGCARLLLEGDRLVTYDPGDSPCANDAAIGCTQKSGPSCEESWISVSSDLFPPSPLEVGFPRGGEPAALLYLTGVSVHEAIHTQQGRPDNEAREREASLAQGVFLHEGAMLVLYEVFSNDAGCLVPLSEAEDRCAGAFLQRLFPTAPADEPLSASECEALKAFAHDSVACRTRCERE
jgi:hypothetical protein